jgi:hypothetical protein
LRQAAGDSETARRLLDQASEIFRTLGTLDEPSRIEVGLAAVTYDATAVLHNRGRRRPPLAEGGRHSTT